MKKSIRESFQFQWRILVLLFFLGTLLYPVPAEARRKAKKQSHNYPAIRNIIIVPNNVFNPNVAGEDHWPYTWVNVIHFTTRPHVIRRELLVKPGDPADPEKLDESERLLRALPFIKEARIKTSPTGDGRVDVIVETSDSWTTQPQLDWGSSGLNNHFSAGILEENLFGYGKNVSYFYKYSQLDGVSREYGYTDPQLFGTRTQLTSLLDDTETGNQEHITLDHPFYSIATPYAGGAAWNHIKELQKVYEDGVQTNAYDRDHNDVDAHVGARLNRNPLSAHRLDLHYKYISDYFAAQDTTVPGTLPTNKKIAGPAPAWNWVQSDFIKETFADKAERIEDINLGHQMGVSLEYASRFTGSTENTMPFSLSDQFGWGTEGDQFFLTSYGMTGRYTLYAPRQEGGKLDNTLYFFNGNYYKHMNTEFPLTGVVHFESAYVQNIDSENQLTLGGDTGLRGFQSNAFTGNKSMLLNLETRAFYPHEVLHLAYLGGACFLDAGQVQQPGDPFSNKDIHASIGMGIRVGLTRSTSGQVYRFDVAYALGPVTQDNRIVFSISSGQGFHRNANTFGGFPGLPISQD